MVRQTRQWTFIPLGDSALLVRFGDRIESDLIEWVHATARVLERRPFPGYRESVPSYASLAVHYDPWTVYTAIARDRGEPPYASVCREVESRLAEAENEGEPSARVVTIPVCYGGTYGPDLDDVAAYHRLSPEQIVFLHSEAEYVVAMIGFSPGFPYLAGLPERLATPRKRTPRPAVPAGSVGIAGGQTGIYPFETPGGWNVIGRTPLKLFRPDADPPSLLRPGDRVRLVAIPPETFRTITETEGGGAHG